MSWGLKYYEQQDLFNRAHFPDVYGNKGQKSKQDGKLNVAKNPLGLSIDVKEGEESVDWKYQAPTELSNEV